LELTDAEVQEFTGQLGAILGYVDKLNELETTDVEPLAHCLPITNVLRKDEVRESLGTEQVLANAPQRDGSNKQIVKSAACDYLLSLPKGYGEKEQKWPLMLFLHGAGERGSDLNLVKKHGPPKLIEQGRELPFIVVSPQCPAGVWWSERLDTLMALLDEIESKYEVDPSRVYLTGLSMGGFGTWALACERPERFAAIVPICGGGQWFLADRLKKVPVWAFHGAKDPVVPLDLSKSMVEAVKRMGGDAKLTVYPEANHDSWTATYDDPKVYEWLLSHRTGREGKSVVSGQRKMKLKRPAIMEIEYLLYLPDGYGQNDQEWPLMLFLHGAGERGADLERVKVHGPPKLVERGRSMPFIIVSPQCPTGTSWSSPDQVGTLIALLDEIVENYRVDESRVYLTGLSMGGYGTWALASSRPERFAATYLSGFFTGPRTARSRSHDPRRWSRPSRRPAATWNSPCIRKRTMIRGR